MSSVITIVEVDRRADGSLHVRWVVDGPPVAVEISVGPTPDPAGHLPASAAGSEVCSATISGVAPEHRFVSVAPSGAGVAAVAADRRVTFEGISNFRDLGGYATRDGRRTRWGRLFRADALHGLTADDLGTYERLGVRVVYDLRGDLERRAAPNPFESRSLVLVGRPASTTPQSTSTAASAGAPPATTRDDGERVLRDMYVGLLEHGAPSIGTLLAGLTEDDGLPAVFHCHAGKDRTGVVAALLLEVLGVERDLVLDDYELTGRYRQRSEQEGSYRRLVAGGMSPEAAAGVLGTPRWAMAEALGVLDAAHGGAEAYLLGPAGLAAAEVAALRRMLVE